MANTIDRAKPLDWNVRLKRQEKHIKLYPVPTDYRPRIAGPTYSWKVFYKQRDAFGYAQSNAEDLHVFSSESASFCDQPGQRLYLVTSYEQFWHYYGQLHSPQRHHYEVIPEGSVCHLYFDLEYLQEQNPDHQGSNMVETFIQYVCAGLKEMYDIECDSSHVIQLGSSTKKKFSRHLVFRLPFAVFKDNIHAGNFVHSILSWLLRQRAADSSTSCNMRQTSESDNSQCCQKGGKQQIKTSDACQSNTASEKHHKQTSPDEYTPDTSLFSKNGCHNNNCSSSPVCGQPSSSPVANRTFGDVSGIAQSGCSSNQEALQLYEPIADELKNNHQRDLCERILKLAHLSMEDLKSLIVKDKDGHDSLFIDTGVYTKNRNFRLYLSCKLGQSNPLVQVAESQYMPVKDNKSHLDLEEQIFQDSLVSNVKYSDNLRILTCDSCPRVERRRGNHKQRNLNETSPQSTEMFEGCGSSPYPEVDQYISTVINRGGVQGYIRRWVYFSQGELLVYDIGKNRWCDNIGRPHKSNNIILLADLKQGIFYQKCHDPVCRADNFRSQGYPLPKHVLPAYYFQEGNDCDDVVDEVIDAVTDEELINAADDAENSLDITDEELLLAATEAELFSD